MDKLFFCFSSKDRQSIIDALRYHLTNYDIPIWYDREQMLLGDERDYKNFVEGVGGCSYSIVILSHNCINSVCANEELDLIYEKYKNNQMYVFPIFYELPLKEIPEKYLWLTHLVYKEMTKNTDIRGTCEHIICKILLDELMIYKCSSILSVLNKCEYSNKYIFRLISSYIEIDRNNKNAKLSILYSAILYITTEYNISSIPRFYYAASQFLFNETKLNLQIEQREILLLERCLLLLCNSVIFSDFIEN